MRLIDADLLEPTEMLVPMGNGNYECTRIVYMDDIDNMPTIEPEQIVRCKDCRYYQDNNGGYPHMNCKWDANETPDEEDFCSGAERLR